MNPISRYRPVGIVSSGPRVIARGGHPVIEGASSVPFGPPGGGGGGGMPSDHHRRRRIFGSGGCGWWGCWGPWSWGPWWNTYPWPWPEVVPTLVGVEDCVPIQGGRLLIDEAWAYRCFAPAFDQARAQWRNNAVGLSTDVLLAVMPDAALGIPASGPEYELRRRIDLAVAILLGAEGIPTRFPPNPPTPRPRDASRITIPWVRALVTGWL
jgi:hypothetical protein